FFQAEDGIRDFHVTGVQTCALPIYRRGTGGLDMELGWFALIQPYRNLVDDYEMKDGKRPEESAHYRAEKPYENRDPRLYATVKLDRKSTRLNSSHVKISYAVFCLKK